MAELLDQAAKMEERRGTDGQSRRDRARKIQTDRQAERESERERETDELTEEGGKTS